MCLYLNVVLQNVTFNAHNKTLTLIVLKIKIINNTNSLLDYNKIIKKHVLHGEISKKKQTKKPVNY